jgi:hypothetical protein
VNHRYFFQAAPAGEGNHRLFVIDTQTGALLANPSFPYNVASLAYELVTSMPREISIDIRPGEFPNNVNPKSDGLLPVAILTTNDFDATSVDPVTVQFGPGGARASKYQLEDVDDDNDVDLLLRFRVLETGIHCGDTTVGLVGNTISGQPLTGNDSIRTVGCN